MDRKFYAKMNRSGKAVKAVTLLEALVAATVISVGIISVFRAFTSSLSATRLSQDITSASFLFKDRLWDLQQRCAISSGVPRSDQEKINVRNKEFTANYEIADTEFPALKKVTYTISWEARRDAPYRMEFDAYLPWEQ